MALELSKDAIGLISRKIERLYPTLEALYGHHRHHPRAEKDPLDELIRTVLSQNTNDTNSQRAWERLKGKFPSWQQLLTEHNLPALRKAIKPGGLSAIKAERIFRILAEITTREGKLSLDRLRTMRDQEVVDYLRSLPGVGLKTAYCVLAFSLGRKVMPVDTHVLRLSQRLGLLPPGTGSDKAHIILNQACPPAERLSLHMNLIAHGRNICRARQPRCEQCSLTGECLYYSDRTGVSHKG
jgi:endonuclease-3